MKKGFTLIELLAVIVILAIIALIATPLVLKYIETSRIESFKVSVENIKDSALKYIANEQLNGKVSYPVIVDVQDLDFKGKEDYIGKVIVQKDGTIEEYIEKGDYRFTSGSLTNGKNKPYLKVKEGKTAVIDDNNNYVYSFYTATPLNGYSATYLTLDVISNIFEVNNGTLEYITNGNTRGPYSTGAKIILKDNGGNIYKEYEFVIFCDNSGDGAVNTMDMINVVQCLNGTKTLSEIQLFASDLNRDNKVDEIDKEMLKSYTSGVKRYNQITNKLEDK